MARLSVAVALLMLGCGGHDCREFEKAVESEGDCWVVSVDGEHSIGSSKDECAPDVQCVEMRGRGTVYLYAPGLEEQSIPYQIVHSCDVRCGY